MIIELAIAAALTTGDTSIPACQPNPDVASTQRYVETPCAAIGQDGTVTIVRDTPSAEPSVSAKDDGEPTGWAVTGVLLLIFLGLLIVFSIISIYEY